LTFNNDAGIEKTIVNCKIARSILRLFLEFLGGMDEANRSYSLFLFFSFFCLLSCTKQPTPISYPFSTQHKIETAHHWDIIAENFASQIKFSLNQQGFNNRYIFISSGNAPTQFTQGFKDFLTTHLVNQGVNTLAEEKPESITVEYNAQVLFHKIGKMNYFPSPSTGAIAVLGAGVIAITDAILSEASKTDFGIAIGGTLLGWSAFDEATARAFRSGQPNSEVIITTSVIDNGLYVMRKTNVYYISDQNFWYYETALHPKTLKVVDYKKLGTLLIKSTFTLIAA
jgi:hypothetical protein